MSPLTRTAWITVLAATSLVLVGCASPAQSADTGSADEGSTDTAAGGCPATDGYEEFSSDLITSAPESGAVYGDGSTLTFGLAMGAGYYPTLDLTYLNADGRPGFASVVVVKDDTFEAPAGQETASQPILGVYCITFAVE